VRENREGALYSLVYGQAVAVHVDPIEKKPLYHFLPASDIFSIGTVGCNFRCTFCQNYDISQASREGRWISSGRNLFPQDIIGLTKRYHCQSVAYTYNEPTIFFEYAYDTAKLAHQEGLKNVFVTNGYMTQGALETIEPYLDAANVDLKSFSDRFYRRVIGGTLQPVLETIERMHQLGIWVEVTTLLIPGHNDSDQELAQVVQFIADIDVDIPWHISRFIPQYKMRDVPVTSAADLHRAAEIGKRAGLKYVYAGNVPGDPYENTRCPECGEVVVSRVGYMTRVHLEDDRCPHCGYELAMVVS